MKTARLFLVGLALVMTAASLEVAADEKPDPRALELLNNFMKALSVPDEDASAKAVMPLVHKSLLAKDGSDLSADLRRFSFHKAHDNAKFYAMPVKITRVRPTRTTGIGFRETAEKGSVVDYFIAKKDGVGGMPAPVKIFFPADGSAPKISYMGSI